MDTIQYDHVTSCLGYADPAPESAVQLHANKTLFDFLCVYAQNFDFL